MALSLSFLFFLPIISIVTSSHHLLPADASLICFAVLSVVPLALQTLYSVILVMME